ncbi:MAG: TolC family protein [Acidobacteria bacterium]|nr:MAG: TolC family protein [Acidobacteriota bacterium]
MRKATLSIPGLALVLLALAPVASLAQEPKTFRTSWKTIDAESSLATNDNVLELRLDEAIAVALQRNLGLRIQRFQRSRALFTVLQNRGIYDYNLTGDGLIRDSTTPAASQLDGADVRLSETQSLNLGLDRLIPTGGVAGLSFTNQRFESNSVFAQINPSFDVGIEAVFSQPLLRGRGRLATERNLRIAGLDAEVALEAVARAVSDTIELVESAYWSLVESRAQLEVARESLGLAEELHEMNKVQVDVGTKAPLELIQSEVGIATRQEDIIRLEADVEDAADSLRELLNLDGPRFWDAQIVPATDPEQARLEIDLDRALATANQERPEVRAARKRIEQLALDSRFFRNQRLPRLGLEVRYGYSGLGGDVAVTEGSIFDPDPVVTIVPGGYDDALDQVIDRDFDAWQVALNFAMPLQNRAARAQSTIADLALEQGETQLEQTLLQVQTDVRRAARGVRTAAQQIDSARISRELAERNLDAEEKRYENGITTSFQVLEIQEDLSQARSREVNAITAYRRALTAFYKATGQLLEEAGVEIEDDTDLETLEPTEQQSASQP